MEKTVTISCTFPRWRIWIAAVAIAGLRPVYRLLRIDPERTSAVLAAFVVAGAVFKIK